MEQLISFVTHNPFILIIIVGLLYSMFFRKSPIEKPGNRPGGRPGNRPGSGPNRMPSFGGSPVFTQRPHQTNAQPGMSRPDSSGRISDPAPQPVFAEIPTISPIPAPDSPYGMPPTPSYSLPQRTEPESHSAAPARTRRTPQVSADSFNAYAISGDRVADLTPDDLKQAVVWAEIIGPPRAKRPYRR